MPAGMVGAMPGTPDHYFDCREDLWCEWKVIRTAHIPARIPKDALPTEKQLAWMERRYAAGGNVICVVGLKLKTKAWGVILETPRLWREGLERGEFQRRLLTSAEIAQRIASRVGWSSDLAALPSQKIQESTSGPSGKLK